MEPGPRSRISIWNSLKISNGHGAPVPTSTGDLAPSELIYTVSSLTASNSHLHLGHIDLGLRPKPGPWGAQPANKQPGRERKLLTVHPPHTHRRCGWAAARRGFSPETGCSAAGQDIWWWAALTVSQRDAIPILLFILLSTLIFYFILFYFYVYINILSYFIVYLVFYLYLYVYLLFPFMLCFYFYFAQGTGTQTISPQGF